MLFFLFRVSVILSAVIIKVSIFYLTRPRVPFILVMIAVLFLITYVPDLIVFIPSLIGR